MLFDVLVAGSGPSGALTALLLAKNGARVAVVDDVRRSTQRPDELLAPAAYRTWSGIVSAPALQRVGAVTAASGIRRAWGSDVYAWEDFFVQVGANGAIVNRAQFDAELRAQAVASGALLLSGRLKCGWAQHGVWDAAIAQAGSSSDLRIRADVLVDATGRPSFLARRLGARRLFTDRMVAHVLEETGKLVGWLDVEARDDGWSYAVGLTQRVLIGVGAGRGGTCFAASSTCLDRAAGEGWIAVGDAACAFDPIASQGLFHAAATAAEAVDVISGHGLRCSSGQNQYSAKVIRTWLKSETQRHEVYASERRWPDSGFWRDRTHARERFARLCRSRSSENARKVTAIPA